MILIFGKNGQVARALVKECEVRKLAYLALGSAECDVVNETNIVETLRERNPRAIINAAAYTQVDNAESEQKIAYAINAKAPGVMAACAAEMRIPFFHLSTDYVFDGRGEKPWSETDKTAPLNMYGISKREGEEAVLTANPQSIIFRTSWVFDALGKNFFTTMLKLFSERKELKVVADQIGAPTYAPHLATSLLSAFSQVDQASGGIYHLAAQGETSWFGFAQAILSAANAYQKFEVKLSPIATSEYPTPARRPLNSRLDCSKAQQVFALTLPAWQDGLKAAIGEKYASA